MCGGDSEGGVGFSWGVHHRTGFHYLYVRFRGQRDSRCVGWLSAKGVVEYLSSHGAYRFERACLPQGMAEGDVRRILETFIKCVIIGGDVAAWKQWCERT